ncbi:MULTISPECIES: hypothetical protein [Sphingomonas]|uniref:Uncharacterized protein n=1 Tax=Sphingomonas molluscorum TaxID=418184 RepID=A0ABU8Q505_9SPHN|nr:hypothetical protein [Sphingomonas sp. JUb134]MBM7405687.1 hypothetical protein [Sphingomonas sp. JUb134]
MKAIVESGAEHRLALLLKWHAHPESGLIQIGGADLGALAWPAYRWGWIRGSARRPAATEKSDTREDSSKVAAKVGKSE